jgi:hypothetical protein
VNRDAGRWLLLGRRAQAGDRRCEAPAPAQEQQQVDDAASLSLSSRQLLAAPTSRTIALGLEVSALPWRIGEKTSPRLIAAPDLRSPHDTFVVAAHDARVLGDAAFAALSPAANPNAASAPRRGPSRLMSSQISNPAPAMWSRRPAAERPQRAGKRPERAKRHTVRQSGEGGRAPRKPVARL